MYQGNRYRIPANEFAIPRMEPGKQRPIQSMEEARDWERRFIGEVKAGLDPARYTIRTVPKLLAGSEAWADYDASERPLADAIRKLGRS
jgi:hypothetical protein